MPFKEKHTRIQEYAPKSVSIRKDLVTLLLAIVFLFTFSQGIASQQTYSSGNATIVYAASDSNKVVITEGRITAVEGKTIHLLPGTHIKGSELLTVNIASKECQDAVAIEVSKEREKTILTSAAIQCEEVINPKKEDETPYVFNACNLPEQNSKVGQQYFQFTASLVNTSVSLTAPISYLNRKNTLNDIHNLQVLAYQYFYTPVSSWGDCAETIKVMRN